MSNTDRNQRAGKQIRHPDMMRNDFNWQQFFKATPEDLQWLKSARENNGNRGQIECKELENLKVSVRDKGRKFIKDIKAQNCATCRRPIMNFNPLFYKDVNIKEKPLIEKKAKILHKNLNFDAQVNGDSDLSLKDLMKVINSPNKNRRKNHKILTAASTKRRPILTRTTIKKNSISADFLPKLTRDEMKTERQLMEIVRSASEAAETALTNTLQCYNVLESMSRNRVIIISSDSESSSDENSTRKSKRANISKLESSDNVGKNNNNMDQTSNDVDENEQQENTANDDVLENVKSQEIDEKESNDLECFKEMEENIASDSE